MKSYTLHCVADSDRLREECALAIPDGGRHRIVLDGHAPRIASQDDDRGQLELVVESVRRGHANVLVVSERSHVLRVNGEAAPLLAIVGENDELRLGAGTFLRVGAHEGPRIVDVDEELAGTPCLVCRTKLGPGRRAYRCPSCARAMHADGADVEADARLECATLVGACPGCAAPVQLEQDQQ